MISTTAAVLTMLFGFMLGYALYEWKRYRLGGIIAVPLIVVYTMENWISLPVIIVAIMLCYIAVNVISSQTLLYGRRLLYMVMMFSIIVTFIIAWLVSMVYPEPIPSLVIFSLFPGLIAYNIRKDSVDFDSSTNSVLMLVLQFIFVWGFAFGISMVV
ncbi:hypothetical protein AZH53_00230 [Methanomicrobiaceae archaeon CYW5]|uniref:poly-gamma-glutamate biosynthesis protein PgsC/CapC n=1 Tax=Methanovulcanius yangii TaxID=1789227 RepID=UPI0029C9EF73|nr:poly-gamma-glutamate biosynthesis protein PgsC/CapC [Methanovulcanius yangii]MBT8506857.1 hypothetical protein [Methanovulcanius yangii]